MSSPRSSSSCASPSSSCSSEREAFLGEVLGTPYDRRRHHCWWLVSLAQERLFGRSLPIAHANLVHDRRRRAEAIERHPERGKWMPSSRPVDGAIVLMRRNAREDIHAGVFLAIAEGRVLHTDDPHGAVLSPILELSGFLGWRLSYFVPAT